MGQLALLRGMAGAPVRSKSYARTKIETGRVGRDHGLSGLQRRRFPTVSRKHRGSDARTHRALQSVPQSMDDLSPITTDRAQG